MQTSLEGSVVLDEGIFQRGWTTRGPSYRGLSGLREISASFLKSNFDVIVCTTKSK